jgi:hypothetical protein
MNLQVFDTVEGVNWVYVSYTPENTSSKQTFSKDRSMDTQIRLTHTMGRLIVALLAFSSIRPVSDEPRYGVPCTPSTQQPKQGQL